MTRYLERVARNLVEARWWAVEAVARALIDRGTLTRPEVGEVIQRALQDAVERQRRSSGVRPPVEGEPGATG